MLRSDVSRSFTRLLMLTALIVLALLLMMWRGTQAIEIPLSGSSVFIQTTGPNAGLNIGDYYTNVDGGNGSHIFEVLVPCEWPADLPVTFALFDPEVQLPDPVSPAAIDELRDDAGDPTTDPAFADTTAFTLTTPGGVTIPQTYAPNDGTNGLWVELSTFMLDTPGFGCGTYMLHTATADNDDNAWRLRVDHDPDCTVAPGTCSGIGQATSDLMDNGNEEDDPDGLPGTGDELVIGMVETSFQRATTECQDFYFFVDGTITPITLNNFDMDFNQSVTYYPPPGSPYAPSQAGTMSGFTVWNNPPGGGTPPPRGGDVLAVGADDVGWWYAEICVDPNNQYIFEGQEGEPIYFEQPPTPVMVVSKDNGVTVTGPNDVLTYTITFTNTSDTTPTPGAAANVELVDTVPSNATYVSCGINAPFTGLCVESGGIVTYTLTETVDAGASGSVRLTVQVNPDAADTVTNSVTLNYRDILGNPYPPETAQDVDVIPPDLQITKRDGGETAISVGQTVTYTLTYTNVSNTDATGVTITEVVPDSTAFNATASLPTVWSCADGSPPGTVCIHNVGDLAGGASGTVFFAVDITELVPFILNTVRIADDGTRGPDPTPEDNVDIVDTPKGTAPDMQIAKTDGGIVTQPGGVIVYTLAYTNTGQLAATGVTITETVPDNTTFNATASLPTVWSCADGALPGTVCALDVGVVAGNGGAGSVSFAVTVDSPLPPGVSAILNSALIGDDRANGPDPTPENNTTDETTPIQLPGIDLSKDVTPGIVVPGMPFTYTVHITNIGQITLDPVRLTDTLPLGFSYVAGSGSPAEPDTIAEPTLGWDNLGALTPGERITVAYAVTAAPGTTGSLLNAAVTEGDFPGGTVSDADDAPVSVVSPALVVDKRLVGQDQDAYAPNYVTFTIAITNVGPSVLDVVPLIDTYDPYYLSYVDSAPFSDDNEDDGEINWTDLTAAPPYGFGTNLAPDEAFLVTTVFTIAHDITSTVNVVTVTGALDEYGNAANADDDAATIVDGRTAIELLYLQALGQANGVLVRWATLIEVDSYGFWLHRAPSADWNEALPIVFMSSQGGGSGAEYAYADRQVELGKSYWYWLVEVDNQGQRTRYGPVSATAGAVDELKHRVYLPLVARR